jgi:hypothetical protein
MSSYDSPIGFATRDSKRMRLSRFHHGSPSASFKVRGRQDLRRQDHGRQQHGWLFGSPLKPGGYASSVVAFIAPVD